MNEIPSDEKLPEEVFAQVIPPYEGFTAEHYLQMPDLPKHTELIDGNIVFWSPQTLWHSHVVTLLEDELRWQAPKGLRAIWGMAVRLGERQAPVPDVILLTADAYDRAGPEANFFWAKDVLLAVEVVAPSSEDRDRDTKPRKYAAAGIPHFWRVEHEDRKPVVHVFEREPATGSYVPTGIYRDRLRLTVPFELDIDLTDPNRRPQ